MRHAAAVFYLGGIGTRPARYASNVRGAMRGQGRLKDRYKTIAGALDSMPRTSRRGLAISARPRRSGSCFRRDGGRRSQSARDLGQMRGQGRVLLALADCRREMPGCSRWSRTCEVSMVKPDRIQSTSLVPALPIFRPYSISARGV